jgi:4-hydroxyphenylacetate 3-monooxygenase
MRLARHVIGTEFAGRHQQYENFYGGASHVVKANLYRSYDFMRTLAMVDRALNLPAPS